MKETFVTLEQVKEITKVFGTPFHLYDEKGIRSNARRLNDAFSWNKGFKEYFAVKATPNPSIIKILMEEGCGTDCASMTELMLSERLGLSGDGIMFSSNVTPASEYRKARELGAIINLDDYTHIDFLRGAAGIPETVCLRVNPGGVMKVSNSVMDNPGDAKFGMTPEQVCRAVEKLQSFGARRFGLHAFLVSNALADEYYPKLAEILFKIAAGIKTETGAEFTFINLSGGIGIPYRPEEREVDIYRVSGGVKEAYNRILVPAGMDDVAIFTELGRYMLGPYGCLVSTAIHEKHTHKDYVGLDSCAVDLMRPAIYKAYHHITVLGKENAPHEHMYDITGSLCENNDKFAIDRMLPEIEVGDFIVIHDTGAHGYSMGYNYNGKLRSKELLLKENGEVVMIRRAETPEDYFATLNF